MSQQHYERDVLIRDVAELLRQRGLAPVLDDEGARRRADGASKLLAGLGITPTLAPEVALDLDGHRSYNARIHGD